MRATGWLETIDPGKVTDRLHCQIVLLSAASRMELDTIATDSLLWRRHELTITKISAVPTESSSDSSRGGRPAGVWLEKKIGTGGDHRVHHFSSTTGRLGGRGVYFSSVSPEVHRARHRGRKPESAARPLLPPTHRLAPSWAGVVLSFGARAKDWVVTPAVHARWPGRPTRYYWHHQAHTPGGRP